MTIEELKHAIQPFMDETTILVRRGDEYLQIVGSSYMHDAEGHLVLVATTYSPEKATGEQP